MITENTVFILGAGASKPYGYPTGLELRGLLCSTCAEKLSLLLDKSSIIDINRSSKEVLDAFQFAQVFEQSGVVSIDRFLAINNEFSSIGKVAIIMQLLEKEKEVGFRDGLADNWYFYLYNRMIESFKDGDSYTRFGDNSVTFVTFNYDRSLEHYLYEHLGKLFHKIPPEDIAKQLRRIPIHHVYGQIDDLPWQGGKRRYGFPYSYQGILEIKDRIRIISERTNSEIESIKLAIQKAKSIYFLGFGYDKSNMDAIGLPDVLNIGQKVRGTSLDATEKEVNDVRKFLSKGGKLDHRNVAFDNCRCTELLRKYL